MKRFALVLTCAMMLSGSGCCLFGYPGVFGGGGYGAGYPPTYGGGGYGGGGACPNGACGQQYPGAYGGGFPGAYNAGAPTAYAPAYGYPQTAYVNPLPSY